MSDTFGATFWDQRYRSSGSIWSGDPNPQLVTEVSALNPGNALDAGCGEGADAIWLAQRGWHVTAVDISAVALERARAVEVPSDVAERIEWRQADLAAWIPPPASFDLVSAQFMQLPQPARMLVFGRLAASVRPRGSLLIVGHHPSDLQTTVARPPRRELFYTAADVAALLEADRWDIVADASRERSAVDSAGRTVAIHDAVLHARRRAL